MTLIDHDPGYQDRVMMRCRKRRFHPNLSSQLFANRLDAAITRHWPDRAYCSLGFSAGPGRAYEVRPHNENS